MTDDELKALRLLLREELQAEMKPFRAEIGKRFDEIASRMDGLYLKGRSYIADCHRAVRPDIFIEPANPTCIEGP